MGFVTWRGLCNLTLDYVTWVTLHSPFFRLQSPFSRYRCHDQDHTNNTNNTLSRCNRAISYVVFLSFSFPSPGEHMPSLVVDHSFYMSCPLHPTLHLSSHQTLLYANLLSQLVHPPPVHSLHSSDPPNPVVFTHLQSMLVFLGNR